MKPSLTYVICTTPRSGSTLLAEALTSTTIAGRPLEYFDVHDHNEKYWLQKLKINSDSEYLDRVIEAATTANGVFGLKLLWHQMPAILAKSKHSLGVAGRNDWSLHELLRQKVGEPRYIWLRRQNKLAQAISYYRASRTGLWRSVDTPPRSSGSSTIADSDLPFDYAKIDHFLRLLNDFDLQWYNYFRRHRVKVLLVLYESFVEAYGTTVHKVIEFLGIKAESIALGEPRLQRQSDDRSLEWEKRFLEMRKDRIDVTRTQHEIIRSPASLTTKSADPAAKPSKRRHPRGKRTSQRPVEDPLAMTAYLVQPRLLSHISTGEPHRDWMDATNKHFAYRCLPMVMANQAGWLLLNRDKLVVTWKGGVEQNALRIEFLSGENPRAAISLFGSGILTFVTGYLFRTPPGYNLYVHGPANWPKDGICPLEGIVEADWGESTFTMNWKVTRANHPIVFEEGEPIAMVTPTPRHLLERFQPEIRKISDHPELEVRYNEWLRSRLQHNKDLKVPNSKARQQGWQRHYMQGITIDSEPAPEHQTALALNDFIDKRG